MRLTGFVLVLPFTFGCADILGLEPATLGQGGAGATATVTVGAGGGGAAAGGGGGGGGAPVTILYVDGQLGDDNTNTGRTESDPKKTIGAALDAALASESDPAGPVGEIHVCAGTYAETLVLDMEFTALPGLALLGGYDCGSWARLSMYAAPFFETLTVLQPTVPEDTVLSVMGLLGDTFLIDGFRIEAGTTLAGPTRAVLIDGGASLLFSNNDIHGGAGVTDLLTRAGSVGVDVLDGEPIVENNRIHGGAGEFDGINGVASVGVHVGPTVDSDAAVVRNNLVFGGTGVDLDVGAVGSAGIVVSPGSPIIESNEVWGGAGSVAVGDATSVSSIGILVGFPANPKIVRNSVNGPSGTWPGNFAYSDTGGGSRGVVLNATALVDGNRIYGGPAFTQADGTAAPFVLRTGQTMAVVVKAPNVTLVNNLIYGGNQEDSPTTLNGPVYALVMIAGSDNAIVAHNAIYTGNSLNVPATATAVSLGAISGLAFDKNLVFGFYGSEFSMGMPNCPYQTLASFRENVFFGFTGGGILTHAANCLTGDPNGLAETIAEAEDAMGLVGDLGNLEVAHPTEANNSCNPTVDPDCIDLAPCVGNSRAPCIFQSWPALPDGYDLLFGEGWKLDPGLDCAEWDSDLVISAAGGEDFLGMPRTMPTSKGPYEQDAWTSMACP